MQIDSLNKKISQAFNIQFAGISIKKAKAKSKQNKTQQNFQKLFSYIPEEAREDAIGCKVVSGKVEAV